MVVQHNLTAMNSNRMLGLTTASQAKATEKLSSGYKINRAADDAAGLAISEKMRKQIRGLTQASSNAQDGISAVQTAEGALTEVHDMLQRMNELAVKAANGTMSESDRAAVQSEIDQLVTEIDRVSTTTKFNETYLLKGSNGGVAGSLSYNTADAKLSTLNTSGGKWDIKTGIGTISVTSQKATIGADGSVKDANAAGSVSGTSGAAATSGSNAAGSVSANSGAGSTDVTVYSVTVNGKQYNYVKSTAVGSSAAGSVSATGGASGASGANASGSVSNTASASNTSKAMSVTAAVKALNASKTVLGGGAAGSVSATGGASGASGANAAGSVSATASSATYYSSMDEMMAAIRHDNGEDVKSVSSYYDSNAATIAIKIEAFADLNDALDFSLHVGADSSDDNKINVNVAQMSARGLGINGLLVNGVGTEQATDAIDVIADALQKVSNQRSTLGAVQNRLEHTIRNLDNIVENTTSAESAVRDTDMATQMVEYSNNNILAQAGQAMLAQSNQTNQGVLSLLG